MPQDLLEAQLMAGRDVIIHDQTDQEVHASLSPGPAGSVSIGSHQASA